MNETTEAPKPLETPKKLWTRGFLFICFTNFLVFTHLQSLWPIIPMYIVSIGGSEKVVGVFAGLYTATTMLMRPISGLLLDRFGRRVVLISGMAALALVSLGYIFAAVLPVLLIVRIIHGASYSTANTSTATVASDLLPPSRIGEGMGLFSLSTSISMAVAPAVGLWVLNRAGYSTLFVTNSVIAFTAVFITLLVTRQIPSPVQHRKSAASPIRFSSLFETQALPAAAVMLLINTITGSVVSFIPLFAVELGISNIGFFFTGMALTTMYSRPMAGRWVDKKGADMLVSMGFILTSVSLIITARSTSLIHLIGAGLLFGIGMTIFLPSMQALILKKVPPHRRGAAMGTFLTGFDLGIGLGATLGGFAADAFGFRVMFLLGILPVALAALVYFASGIGKTAPEN